MTCLVYVSQPMEGVSSTAAVELLSYTKAIVKPRLAYQGRGENGVKLGTVRKFRSPVLAAKPRPRSKPRLCEVVTQPLSKKSPAMLLKTNTVTGKTRAGSPYAQQVCCSHKSMHAALNPNRWNTGHFWPGGYKIPKNFQSSVCMYKSFLFIVYILILYTYANFDVSRALM